MNSKNLIKPYTSKSTFYDISSNTSPMNSSNTSIEAYFDYLCVRTKKTYNFDFLRIWVQKTIKSPIKLYKTKMLVKTFLNNKVYTNTLR